MRGTKEKSPYAGQTVKTKAGIAPDALSGRDLSNQDFTVEDWWENVYGMSWTISSGNAAALGYAMRPGFRLPLDDVLYGKIGGMGYILHVSELELPGVVS